MDTNYEGIYVLILQIIMCNVLATELGTYVGCVLNTFPTSVYYVMPGDMTNENCASFCCFISTNMTFSGTMTEDKCLCRDERTITVQFSNSCNNRCSGNSSQICGGYSNPPRPMLGPSYYLSLYKLSTIEAKIRKPKVINSVECLKAESSETECQLQDCSRLTSYQCANTSSMSNSNQTTTNTSAIKKDNAVSQKQLEVQLDKLRTENLIDKTTTTLYRSKKRCATDNRKSARNLGMFGITFLIFPVCLIVGNDFLRVFRRPQ